MNGARLLFFLGPLLLSSSSSTLGAGEAGPYLAGGHHHLHRAHYLPLPHRSRLPSLPLPPPRLPSPLVRRHPASSRPPSRHHLLLAPPPHHPSAAISRAPSTSAPPPPCSPSAPLLPFSTFLHLRLPPSSLLLLLYCAFTSSYFLHHHLHLSPPPTFLICPLLRALPSFFLADPASSPSAPRFSTSHRRRPSATTSERCPSPPPAADRVDPLRSTDTGGSNLFANTDGIDTSLLGFISPTASTSPPTAATPLQH